MGGADVTRACIASTSPIAASLRVKVVETLPTPQFTEQGACAHRTFKFCVSIMLTHSALAPLRGRYPKAELPSANIRNGSRGKPRDSRVGSMSTGVGHAPDPAPIHRRLVRWIRAEQPTTLDASPG